MPDGTGTPSGGEIVVDADGHLCEPPDLWTRGLPPHLAERGLRLRWNESTGYDELWVEDRIATDRGLVGLGNAGESYVDLGRGRHYEDLNPAGFDADERVKVLDAEDIDVSVMYPGLGLKLGGILDPELAVWSCRVYNDWLAGWCGRAPARLKGAGALPLQDPAAAAEEARRIRDVGLVAGFARPNPYHERPLHDPVYEPVWEALEELGLPIGFHITGTSDMPGAARQVGRYMALGTHHALIPLFDQIMTLSNLVLGGVLERHPGLRVIVLECGGGWIGHWMDRMNEFRESYGWIGDLSLLPSEYFARQCWVSFDPGERSAGAVGDLYGIADRLVWASDFPHSDAMYPGVVDELREHATDLTPVARAGLFGLNACAMYGIDVPPRRLVHQR